MGAVAVTIVMFATACSQDDSVDSNETTQTDGVGVTIPTSDPDTEPQPEAAPQEVRDNPKDWALPGRDYANSRATFDSLISTENVDRLEEVWRAEVGGALSTVPLIVDDTVYVQDSTGTIYAFDAETGDMRWQSEPSGFNIGPFGVAVADGRVFGLHGSNGIVAVDIDSGEELWVTKITSTPTEGVDIQPLAYDGVVLASTVPISIDGIYRGGDRGILHALDAETGDVLWTFDTVKSEDLWGNPEVNSGGGSWYPPSIDPDRGLVYWGVANPAPFPGTPEFPNGSSRPGPNLYTNSAVALDLSTGGLRWYQQVISHDLFDRDLVHTMLVTLGDGSDVVVATGKGGTVVGIDPDGGDLLW
ncbi:MAG: PQQ-binding-like beta-propeller repeat protein, partial [Acidobacteria bacterium]|nr:PQQ-binding-like beta-propeller repeat protein [Acidobacteriota bacterium]